MAFKVKFCQKPKWANVLYLEILLKDWTWPCSDQLSIKLKFINAKYLLYLCMCACWITYVLSDSLWPHGLYLTRLLCSWDFPGKNIGVDCHFLLQEIFLTQGLNPGLLHCRQTLYCLSHQGSPCLVAKLCPILCNPMEYSVPGVCSNSCPLNQWSCPTISFSASLFASCPQSFPASGSFPMGWLFASGGQRIEASA